MLFECRYGYWTYGAHVFAVTDDLLFARSLLLKRIEDLRDSRFDAMQFAEFEARFDLFRTRLDGVGLYYSLEDHHFQLSKSTMIVAVGGLSTVRAMR
jgi:hypothetical protein